MPSVNIREIDRTGAETLEQNDFIVLVPGVYLEYQIVDPLSGKTTWEPFEGILSKVSQFKQLFRFNATWPAPKCFYKDFGFQLAYQLVAKGFTVRYSGAYTYDSSTTTEEALGSKKYLSVINPLTGDESDLTEEDFFARFSDKGKYDLRFITVGGFDIDYVEAGIRAMQCAGDRADAVALLDVPAKGDINVDTESGTVTYPNIALNSASLIDMWVKSAFAGAASTSIKRVGVSWEDSQETYGRYAAIFGPEVLCNLNVVDPTGANKAVSTTMKMPASFDYLICFNQQLQTYPEWFATAGAARGVSPLVGLVPTLNFGDADINLLQSRSGDDNDGHIATNVVCNIPPFGNIVWGNRTMHPLGKPAGLPAAAVQLTASSFLNIRQLCCTLKKVIYRACRRYSFDPNSDTLWYNFKNAITPTLEKMKSNQGIRGYQIVPVTTNKKALLVAKIIISPIEAVEDFDVDVILSDNIEITEA